MRTGAIVGLWDPNKREVALEKELHTNYASSDREQEKRDFDLIDHLTNPLESKGINPFSAFFVTPRTDLKHIVQDTLLPHLSNRASVADLKGSTALKVCFYAIFFFADLVSIPFRLITLLPRIFYNFAHKGSGWVYDHIKESKIEIEGLKNRVFQEFCLISTGVYLRADMRCKMISFNPMIDWGVVNSFSVKQLWEKVQEFRRA